MKNKKLQLHSWMDEKSPCAACEEKHTFREINLNMGKCPKTGKNISHSTNINGGNAKFVLNNKKAQVTIVAHLPS